VANKRAPVSGLVTSTEMCRLGTQGGSRRASVVSRLLAARNRPTCHRECAE
jgi:hypothetical protein